MQWQVLGPLHWRIQYPLHKFRDSAVLLHLKEKGHSFGYVNVPVLDWEARWFEREVNLWPRPSMYTEQPSSWLFIIIYLPVLKSLPTVGTSNSTHTIFQVTSHVRVGQCLTVASPKTSSGNDPYLFSHLSSRVLEAGNWRSSRPLCL